ncbi:MAG: PilZ domain-containing protein [Candidatus Methylomirabilales bacterium]
MERRRHPRYYYEASVTYRQLGPHNPGRIHNLSEGGLVAEFSEMLPPGTPLDLHIPLGDKSIHAEAEVVWTQESPDQPGRSYRHGLKFTRLHVQDLLRLEVFISQVLRGK